MSGSKIFFLWSAAAAATSVALAGQPPKTSFANLSCGRAYLRAQTTSIAHVGAQDGLVWTAQRITIRNVADKTARAIPIDTSIADAAPVAQGGLPAMISSWQCLHGTHQELVVLWLACNRSDKGGACHGQSEWQLLVDLNGRRLDSGYALQDKRYEALMKKLGVSVDGIHLEDAIGN